MSRRDGWRASPRPAISCSARRARRRSDRILLIGGDDSPVGPFRASLDLLATGVVERHGIGNVAFAGYPEGHPAIDARTLDAALQAKVALAQPARAGRVAGDAVRLRGGSRSCAGSPRCARGASTARCTSASPDPPVSRRWRSSPSAAASARRCAHWRAATRRSRASWRRPARRADRRTGRRRGRAARRSPVCTSSPLAACAAPRSGFAQAPELRPARRNKTGISANPACLGSAGFPLQIRAMVTGYPSYSAMYRQRIYLRRGAEGSR